MHQPHDGGKAALKPDRVLGHLALGVSGGQVSERADRGLGDLLPVPGRDDGLDESLDAPDLAHDNLVLLVVAGQVGQDSGGAGDDVDVTGAQKLH